MVAGSGHWADWKAAVTAPEASAHYSLRVPGLPAGLGPLRQGGQDCQSKMKSLLEKGPCTLDISQNGISRRPGWHLWLGVGSPLRLATGSGRTAAKGAEGAAACCSRRGAVAISEHGKLYDMIMRSRFIMHERSGRGAPLDTGPLFLARTARALSS